ncbi:hypothetical protein DL98DRAFT_572232 [Cadophora sp. DSE1049]|nr:hypothetical protein DL98DRAFT_572232 [Cadophora sp. DSE1049]
MVSNDTNPPLTQRPQDATTRPRGQITSEFPTGLQAQLNNNAPNGSSPHISRECPTALRTETNKEVPSGAPGQLGRNVHAWPRSQVGSSAVAPSSAYIPPHSNGQGQNRETYNGGNFRSDPVSGGGMNTDRQSAGRPHSNKTSNGEMDTQRNVQTNRYPRPPHGDSRNSNSNTSVGNPTLSLIPQNNERLNDERSQSNAITSGGMNTQRRHQVNQYSRPPNSGRNTGSSNTFNNYMLSLIPPNIERQSDGRPLSITASSGGMNIEGRNHAIRDQRNSNSNSNSSVRNGHSFQSPRPASATPLNTRSPASFQPTSRPRRSYSSVRSEVVEAGGQRFSNGNARPNPPPHSSEESPGDFYEPAWLSLPTEARRHFHVTRYGLGLGACAKHDPELWQIEKAVDREKCLERARQIEAEPLRDINLTGASREFLKDIYHLDQPKYGWIDLDVDGVSMEHWPNLLHIHRDMYEPRTAEQKEPSFDLKNYINAQPPKAEEGQETQVEESFFGGVTPSDIEEKINKILSRRQRTAEVQIPGHGEQAEEAVADSGVATQDQGEQAEESGAVNSVTTPGQGEQVEELKEDSGTAAPFQGELAKKARVDSGVQWSIQVRPVQRKLERRQFNELDEADQNAYQEIKSVNDSLNDLDAGADVQVFNKISKPFGIRGLSYLDVEAILTDKAIDSKVVDVYMNCITNYVNSVRRPVASGTSGQLAECPQTGYQAIEPMQVEDSEQQRCLSCGVMRTEQLQQCTSVENARRVLESMNCSGENFKNLDYLLIAYGNGTPPRQRYVFIIDSIASMIFFKDELPRSALLRILFSQVPQNETWPLYTQYAQKSDETIDGSPNAARQGDHYNCGVFTVTNAFGMAFGFDLMCYRQGDLGMKRNRILMELNQGCFGGKYAYDLLDVPNGPLYLNPVINPQFAKYPGESTLQQGIGDLLEDDDEEDGTLDDLLAITGDYDGPGAHELEEEEDEDGEQKPYIDLTPPAGALQEPTDNDLSSEGESSYLYEAHGMVDVDDDVMDWEAASAEPSTPTEESEPDTISGQVNKLIPSAGKAIYYDFVRHSPHMHRAWNSGHEYIRVSETERLAHPPQLNPEYFQKHGFLYPSLPQTPSDGLLAQYLIEERIAAYKLFPIQGIEEWEHKSPDVIDRWAQNKMAAFVAQYWDESVKPDPWLVKGYEEWHEKHAAKERDTFAFLKEMWSEEGNPDFESRRDVLYQHEFIREKMKAKGALWKDLR